MFTRRQRLAVFCGMPGLAVCLLTSGVAWGADTKIPDMAEPQAKELHSPAWAEAIRQPGDDILTPLVPEKPRKAAMQARLDAITWYMTGQLRERRNDFTGALEAYKKAVAIDPEGIAIYRALVPLAFSLDQQEEAVTLGLKAIELDPHDFSMLRRIGIHLATNDDLDRGTALLERAALSPKISKDSSEYVTINRDLAILFGALGKKEKAADAYEVLFDAMTNPDKYGLPVPVQRMLESGARTSYEVIGQSFLAANRTELALQAFELAAKKQNGNPGNLAFNLAQVYLQSDKPKKALKELNVYLNAQLQSKGRAAYQLLADIYKKQKQDDKLIPRLEELADNDARNSQLQYFLAEQYLADNQLAKAEARYQAMLEGSKDPEGYAGLAAVYRRQNKPKELLESLTKAIAGGARGAAALIDAELKAISGDEKLLIAVTEAARQMQKDNELPFAGSFLVGKLSTEGKQTPAAIEFYTYALEQRRDRADAIYRELGNYLFEVRDYKAAAAWFDRATKDPGIVDSRPNYLFRLSQAQALAGNTDAALTAVQEAQKSLPNVGLLFYQEAWIRYMAEDYDKSIVLLESLEKRFPEDREIIQRGRSILSNIYVLQGNIRKGEEVLERILEEDPENVSVNNDLGYLYADQGKNLEKAKTMIAKALAAEPDNSAYLDSMGWVLYKLGDFKGAIEYLEKAVDDPDGSDMTLWDHLGDAYRQAGQPKKALEAWQKALEASKDDVKPDKKVLKRLKEKLENADKQPADPEAP